MWEGMHIRRGLEFAAASCSTGLLCDMDYESVFDVGHSTVILLHVRSAGLCALLSMYIARGWMSCHCSMAAVLVRAATRAFIIAICQQVQSDLKRSMDGRR